MSVKPAPESESGEHITSYIQRVLRTLSGPLLAKFNDAEFLVLPGDSIAEAGKRWEDSRALLQYRHQSGY